MHEKEGEGEGGGEREGRGRGGGRGREGREERRGKGSQGGGKGGSSCVVMVTHSLEQDKGAIISRVNPHCHSNCDPLMSSEEAAQLLSEGKEGLAGGDGGVAGEETMV